MSAESPKTISRASRTTTERSRTTTTRSRMKLSSTCEDEFDFLLKSFPGTLTYGEMVGAETIGQRRQPRQGPDRDPGRLGRYAGRFDTTARGASVLDEHGVILNPNDEFGGFVGIEQDDLKPLQELALASDPILPCEFLTRSSETPTFRMSATGEIPAGRQPRSRRRGAHPGLRPTPLPPSQPPSRRRGAGIPSSRHRRRSPCRRRSRSREASALDLPTLGSVTGAGRACVASGVRGVDARSAPTRCCRGSTGSRRSRFWPSPLPLPRDGTEADCAGIDHEIRSARRRRRKWKAMSVSISTPPKKRSKPRSRWR